MNVALKMGEPMDVILRVLKRKQRYSIDSINSSEESFDSKNKLKAHKKANGGIPKVALKSQAKDYCKAKKKTQIIKKDEKEKKLQPMHKTKRLAEPTHSVENQIENFDEVDQDSDYKIKSSAETDKNSSYKIVTSDETDDDSFWKTESSDEASDISDYNPENSDESCHASISDIKVVYDSSISDESYDSDEKENSYINVKNKKKVKKKEKVNNVKSTGVMSSYEKMVEQKKREAMAFLQSLKINEIKADLNALAENKKDQSENTAKENRKQMDLQSHSLVQKKAKAKRKTKKYYKGLKNEEIRLEPMRKSKRVAMQTENVENQSVCEHAWSFKDTFAMESNIYEEYVDNVTIKIPKQTKSLFYSKSTFESLNLDPSNEFCLKGNYFSSLTWHPSSSPLILVAGNRQGYIAVMNIETDAYFFKPHKNLVSHVQFNPFNPAQLFSTSVDGKLLCGDMVKHIFSEVYNYDVALNYFDIFSLTTCLIAQKNGKVAIVDNRTRRKRATQLTCHTNSIETVNLHPTNQNYFVTAENKGSIQLWDLRRIQEHPVTAVNIEKTLNSAFFSPVTGNSILATTDCEVCCFDSTHLTGNLNLLHKKKFGNFHSCRARASWVPNSDKMFVLGSADKKNYKIEVYDENMELYHLLMKRESISNCTFINAFHPYIPAFASAYTLVPQQGHILVYM